MTKPFVPASQSLLTHFRAVLARVRAVTGSTSRAWRRLSRDRRLRYSADRPAGAPRLEHLKSCLERQARTRSGRECNVYCSNRLTLAINVVYAEYFAAYKPARIFIAPQDGSPVRHGDRLCCARKVGRDRHGSALCIRRAGECSAGQVCHRPFETFSADAVNGTPTSGQFGNPLDELNCGARAASFHSSQARALPIRAESIEACSSGKYSRCVSVWPSSARTRSSRRPRCFGSSAS